MNKSTCLILLLITGLSSNLLSQRLPWPLGDVSAKKLDQRIFTYHMFDTAGVKVGSMVTQLSVEDDKIIFIDTSQFDNGSIYENAKFIFSKNPIKALQTEITLRTPRSNLDFNFEVVADSIKGTVLMEGDEKLVKIPVVYDITRAEIYAFLHAIDFTKKIKYDLKVFEPTSVRITMVNIEFEGEVDLETLNGIRKAYKVHLDGRDAIPSNIIYIDKELHHVLKYEVLSPVPLDIQLIGIK